MYRSIQFEHCIGSLLTHYCMTLLSALFYISSCSVGNTDIEVYRQNTLQTVRFARLRFVFKPQLDVKHGRNFYSCKMPSLSPNNITMMDYFPHRSKRGVEQKANYPNIRNKRSLFSMLEKRLPHRGFKSENKK